MPRLACEDEEIFLPAPHCNIMPSCVEYHWDLIDKTSLPARMADYDGSSELMTKEMCAIR